MCHRTSDQHLLAHCDECLQHVHLACLEPPLTRMPKKSKHQSWQCSACVATSSDDDPEKICRNLSEAKRRRRRRAAAAAVNNRGGDEGDEDEDEEDAVVATATANADAPRKLRESIKEPNKFIPENIPEKNRKVS